MNRFPYLAVLGMFAACSVAIPNHLQAACGGGGGMGGGGGVPAPSIAMVTVDRAQQRAAGSDGIYMVLEGAWRPNCYVMGELAKEIPVVRGSSFRRVEPLESLTDLAQEHQPQVQLFDHHGNSLTTLTGRQTQTRFLRTTLADPQALLEAFDANAARALSAAQRSAERSRICVATVARVRHLAAMQGRPHSEEAQDLAVVLNKQLAEEIAQLTAAANAEGGRVAARRLGNLHRQMRDHGLVEAPVEPSQKAEETAASSQEATTAQK